MANKVRTSTSKISARTLKLQGEAGITAMTKRRSGLGKILTVLSRGSRVVANRLTVELCAAKAGL